MRSLSLPLALALGASLAAQNVRPSIQVDTTSTGFGLSPSFSSDGNVCGVVYNDGGAGGSNTVSVVLSDGHGRVWSAPKRIDSDGTAARKFTQADSLRVVGTTMYAVFEDERNGASNEDLFFTRSFDVGNTWATDARVDVGFAPGVGAVRDWRFVVSPDAGGDHLYLLVSLDPDTSSNEELYLIASHDGGTTFSSPVEISGTANGASVDVNEIDLAADGLTVWVAWDDDRGGGEDDLFFNRSSDGGATWLATDVQLDASGLGVGDVESDVLVAARGALVAVVWQEELASATDEEVHARVSIDGGVTFAADQVIGGYTPGTHDVDFLDLALSGANVAVAWRDDRTGDDEIYVCRTTDSGVTWLDVQVSTTGGSDPRFAGGGADLGVTYTDLTATTNLCKSNYSRDGGVTWQSGDLTVSDAPAFDADTAIMGYNELYGNFFPVYLSNDLGTNNVYVSGFRPQTLTAVSFVQGQQASFDLAHFTGSDPLVWVFLSASEGVFPVGFGDSRYLALHPAGGLFLLSLNSPAKFLTTLDGNGAGSTARLSYDKPPGFTFHAAAVSFGLGPVTLAELTDPIEVIGQ